jgi:ADP-ribosyl-[dinitrogen reductase] hydrolase
MKETTLLSRAQGALLGQLIGDALGSAVEGWTPEAIRAAHPDGVREMLGNDTLGTIPGQPTDDSEMALVLARSLVEHGEFDAAAVRSKYREWFTSGAFGYGETVGAAMQDGTDEESASNGALMRVSPIGIFGSRIWSGVVEFWAREDGAITHPHPVCLAANEFFAVAIATAIRQPAPPEVLYAHLSARTESDLIVGDIVITDAMKRAKDAPPPDYLSRPGLVSIALQNALWQLLHAPSFEEALVDTIARGGDTDTNAAVCGALLGAVHGRVVIPKRWVKTVLACKPKAGKRGVARPRPPEFWPADALELAEKLVADRPLDVAA